MSCHCHVIIIYALWHAARALTADRRPQMVVHCSAAIIIKILMIIIIRIIEIITMPTIIATRQAEALCLW